MVADYTNSPPELKAKLYELNSVSIPLIAIYSGGDPEHPIILPDSVTESQVLEALKTAGPSKNAESIPTAAGNSSNSNVQ